MNLSGKIFYNGIATVVATLSGLLRNKIYALFLSLNLFGILSLGQQSASLLVTIFAFGMPLGITTLSAQILSLPDEERKTRIGQMMSLSIIAGGGIFVIICVAIFLFPTTVSRLVTGDSSYSLPVTIVLLGVPFTLIHSCLYAMMEGMGRVKEIVLFRIAPSLLTLPAIYFLAANYHFTGAAAGILFNEVLLVVFALFIFRKEILFTGKPFHLSDTFSKIYTISLFSFIAGVSWLFIDFFIKRYVLEISGEVGNGIVQSVAKVTDLYPNVALAWLTMHLFPLLGEKKEDKAYIAATIERTMSVALAIIFPVIIGIFAFRELILEIIYKKEFIQASLFFGSMLVTGIPKVFTWVIGISLLPIGMKRDWFISTMMYALLYALIAWVGLHSGLTYFSLPIALIVSMSVQAGYVIMRFKKTGITFSNQFHEYLLASTVMMSFLIGTLFYELFIFLAIGFYIIFLIRYKMHVELIGKLKNVLSGK